MNEQNEWDHRISAGVKEGPADCIRIDKVGTALKKMKRHKAQACQASSRNPPGILLKSGLSVHRWTDGHTKVKTVYPPVSLHSLGGCNNSISATFTPFTWRI